MAAVAEPKVAEMLPNTLVKMMQTLSVNGIRSWQCYTDRIGISLRIRFYPDGSVGGLAADNNNTVHASSVYMDKPNIALLPLHTGYSKKTPSQIRRDHSRKTLRAKRQRVESDSDGENERKNETEDISYVKCDTPLLVSCAAPEEDTLILEPLTPIKVDFCENEETCKVKNGDQLSDVYDEKDDTLLLSPVDGEMSNINSQVDKDRDSAKSDTNHESGLVTCPCCGIAMHGPDHVCEVNMVSENE